MTSVMYVYVMQQQLVCGEHLMHFLTDCLHKFDTIIELLECDRIIIVDFTQNLK